MTLEITKGDYEALRAMLSRYGYEYFGAQFTNRLLDELKSQKPEKARV